MITIKIKFIPRNFYTGGVPSESKFVVLLSRGKYFSVLYETHKNFTDLTIMANAWLHHNGKNIHRCTKCNYLWNDPPLDLELAECLNKKCKGKIDNHVEFDSGFALQLNEQAQILEGEKGHILLGPYRILKKFLDWCVENKVEIKRIID